MVVWLAFLFILKIASSILGLFLLDQVFNVRSTMMHKTTVNPVSTFNTPNLVTLYNSFSRHFLERLQCPRPNTAWETHTYWWVNNTVHTACWSSISWVNFKTSMWLCTYSYLVFFCNICHCLLFPLMHRWPIQHQSHHGVLWCKELSVELLGEIYASINRTHMWKYRWIFHCFWKTDHGLCCESERIMCYIQPMHYCYPVYISSLSTIQVGPAGPPAVCI